MTFVWPLAQLLRLINLVLSDVFKLLFCHVNSMVPCSCWSMQHLSETKCKELMISKNLIVWCTRSEWNVTLTHLHIKVRCFFFFSSWGLWLTWSNKSPPLYTHWPPVFVAFPTEISVVTHMRYPSHPISLSAFCVFTNLVFGWFRNAVSSSGSSSICVCSMAGIYDPPEWHWDKRTVMWQCLVSVLWPTYFCIRKTRRPFHLLYCNSTSQCVRLEKLALLVPTGTSKMSSSHPL